MGYQGTFLDKAATCKIYDEWNAKVQRVVPQQRLLVFSVKEGWGPLCKFLGKQQPEGDFPRVNERDRFANEMKAMRRVDFVGKFIVAPALLALVSFSLRHARAVYL